MQPETSPLSFAFLLILFLLNLAVGVLSADKYTRDDFPPEFVFGSGTSAYQVEGDANEDGRTPSIWDTFTHAGHAHGDNGDLACDEYHKYKESNHVTLHNYDLPQALEDEYGGWVSRDIIRDFTDYADVWFREFGDRVLYWNTVNEPNVFALGGYDKGTCPPKRCSPPFGLNCFRGNSTSEPYLAVHHILLAHSSAARLYRRKYRNKQHGFVGISVYAFGYLPQTNTEKDTLAVQRAHDFLVGWILEPLVYGDYPVSMKTNAGSRIPAFTNRESKQDIGQDLYSEEEYPVTPRGIQQVLETFKLLYGNPPMYIYENGQRTARNSSLQDVSRVKYLHGYIGGVLDALRNGSNTRGYFAWSFLDLFELLDGYRSSFGLYYVDCDDPDLKRYPKLSAQWYSRLLRGGRTSTVGSIDLDLEKDPSVLSVARFFR